ncbi:hypothetical protein ACFOGI_08940 [Virgibacillus xinjiangensis]|uniref:Uncharacterized protein n=1 Tax=Virgibacillus xinjiangensis TaxID=393090 RepID=A0ABV7CVL3_9BACI
MSISKIMRLITGIFEALLGIPFLGGIYIISNAWTPLLVMLVLHIITLLLTRKDGGAYAGSVLGIITSLIAWFPVVGMFMHILTAIVLFITLALPDRNRGV